MRIAIMTIQSANYGNRLQNWALQIALEEMEHDVETLRRNTFLKASLKSKLRSIRCFLGRVRRLRIARNGRFRKFDRRVSFSRFVVFREYVSPGLIDVYDAFVMGSDQIWNPDFGFNSDLDYLYFVPREKKLSYAASFGVFQIAENCELIASYLRDIPSISVREDAGAAIVEDLIGTRAEVVLDPTMLIRADVWHAVARKPKANLINTPFMLKYVLGHDAYEDVMTDLARERGFAVVDLKDLSLSVGPAEFVWLVENAAMVCTDSFHGSVFSMLFHRPFIIFERCGGRVDMSSRFDTLCRVFDMEHHRYCKDDFDLDCCENEDWDAFERRLDSERARSLTWLETALAKVGSSRA